MNLNRLINEALKSRFRGILAMNDLRYNHHHMSDMPDCTKCEGAKETLLRVSCDCLDVMNVCGRRLGVFAIKSSS